MAPGLPCRWGFRSAITARCRSVRQEREVRFARPSRCSRGLCSATLEVMTRRTWPLGLVLAALALLAAGWWLLGTWVEAPTLAVPGGGGRDVLGGEPAPRAMVRPRSSGSRVTGVVLLEGRPVEGARVTLRGGATLIVTSDGEGRFRFEDVPSAPAWVSAAFGAMASEPHELAPRRPLDEVVLVLVPTVRIEGVVVDLRTRAPVPDASVTTAETTSRTDASGRFLMTSARGPAWLEVSAPGYLPRSDWVALERANRGGHLEVVLTPACRLVGRVTEAGAPVGGATVWVEQLAGANQGARSAAVVSGQDGAFELLGPSGLLRLWGVTPRGARLAGPLLRLAVGEAREGLELAAEATSGVEGVLRLDEQPLVGAQLTALDAATEAVAAVATSGPGGRFFFPPVATGRYVVQVRHGALVALAGPFEQRGDGQPWMVAVSAGASLEGRVEPAGPGVRVRWRSGAWPGPVAETVTDGAGRFRFEGLPAEPVALEAEGPGGTAAARVTPGEEVVLRLGRGSVVVRLQDDLGRPVTDGVLLVRGVETGATQRRLVLAPDGVTKLELARGPWDITLEASGRGRSGTARVEIGDAPLEVLLSLEVAVAVRGAVRDAENGLPLSGAQIDAFSGGAANPFRISVATDARGEFVLPPTPRSAQLVARHPQYRSATRQAGEGERWDVALARAPHEVPAAPAFQFEGVGMVLDNRSGSVLVASVNEGGPAERAGVQKGDEILAVEGAPVAGMPIEQVVGVIRGPAGTPVRLQLRRSGQSFVVTVRRRLLTL